MLKEEEYFKFILRDRSELDKLSARADLTPREAAALKRYTEIADLITSIGSRFGVLDARRRSLREGESLSAAEQMEYDKLRADLADANRVFEIFLRQLQEDFSTRREARKTVEEIRGDRSLQADLRRWGKGAVTLYTIVGEDRYRVILTTPDVQIAQSYEIKAADLNRRVLEFRGALENPASDPLPLARELYDILLRPVEKDLRGAKARTLIWSLDGTLRYLPIAALHDGKQYVAERYQNVIITLASRKSLSEPPSKQWRGLGLGVSERWPGFDPLDKVLEELRNIIRDESVKSSEERGIVPGRRLLDRAFTQQSFQAALGRGYSVVHIASHFNSRPGNERESYLLLGDGSKMTLDVIRTATRMFDGTELLTLSACNTATRGTGDEPGSEVEGFAVIAQEQGASAVLATLWKVADESTPLLMREFYQYLVEHRDATKAEALRNAQLKLLHGEGKHQNKNAYSHPFFWAPFILIGNWR
jgi:CHAT domain-containing protein